MQRAVFIVVLLLLLGAGAWYLSGKYDINTIFGILTTPANTGTNEYRYSNASSDTITVDAPHAGAVVGKSFSVTGHARGLWFFEASFPVVVLDQDGNVLASAPATTTAEWMTNDLIPFTADLMVPESYVGPATLELKKDNPSGDPRNDASLSYPITVQY